MVDAHSTPPSSITPDDYATDARQETTQFFGTEIETSG
jgi:hypothetical protein